MSEKRLVGFDSKRFRRGNFQALLGVGVTIANLDSYKKKYDELMNNAFNEFGLERRRPLYKAFDLAKLFYSKNYFLPEKLFAELADEISFIDIYYSYFRKTEDSNSNNDEFIKIYHDEKTGIEQVTPIKFIDIIEHSYPAICTWRYISKYSKINAQIYSDHFSLNPSSVWNSIKANQNYSVAYKGDQTNYLVNTADIFLAAIEKRIQSNSVMLNRSIRSILPEYDGKFETEFIGSKYLYDLSPAAKWMVDTTGRILHPVYFVFTEGNAEFKKIFPNQNENDFLENSLFMDKVYAEATRSNGCVKLYDAKTDNAIIRKEDVFFYYGDNGKLKINLLKSLGYKNKIISGEELSNNS